MRRLASTATWWQVRPTSCDQLQNVLIVLRRGTHRETSRHGYDRARSAQARESALHGRDDGTAEERRIATTRERFTEVLGGRPRARILLEASTARPARLTSEREQKAEQQLEDV